MLKQSLKTAFSSLCKLQRPFTPIKYVFLVGHMRSASSLLTHIMASHPAITGFGETHLRYRSIRDLDQLVFATARGLRRLRLRPYLMDKVLHEGYLCEELLRHPSCYFIYLLREPVGTIRSLMHAIPEWNKDPNIDRQVLESRSFNHYNTRLHTIEREATGLSDLGRTAFLTHEQLIHRTGEVFRMIEGLLGLEPPLSEEYSLTRKTAVFGAGDTSDNIKKGFIDRSISHEDYSISRDSLEESIRLYDRIIARLPLVCTALSPATAELSANQAQRG